MAFVIFYHCSVCGMALENTSIETDYDNQNTIIKLAPCSQCAAQQRVQNDSATASENQGVSDNPPSV